MELFPFAYAYAYAHVVCEPGIHKHMRKHKSFLVSGIHQKIKSRPALSPENMAKQVNEKLAESVRNYSCLYDKTSLNRDKKMLAWSDVAKEVGLQNKVIIIALCLSFHKNVSYPDLPRFSLCLSLHN